MQASENCAKFIADFEGGQSRDGLFHPYWDSLGGVWTIGYGHTEGVTRNSRPLTKAQALKLLRDDLNKKYAPAVDQQLHAYHVRKLLSQNAFDALVSLAYNLGAGILGPSHTIGQALEKHDLRAAADAFLLYDHAGGRKVAGLTRRRKAERALFLKPVPKGAKK
jgi:lysozyme